MVARSKMTGKINNTIYSERSVIKMDRINCHSFERYKKTFKPVQERCSCGGLYSCVDLSKSNRNTLALMCNNEVCPSVTVAHRINNKLAFERADSPRPRS